MVWIIYWRNLETPVPQLEPWSGWRQSVRTVENVDTVNDLVLSHKGVIKINQTSCQIARETGIHHSPVYSIIHQYFWLKCLKKRRAQELTTATVYISQDLPLVLQGRVGAHKLGVVGNTIYVLLQISSSMLLPKIMKIGSRIKKVITKIKRV